VQPSWSPDGQSIAFVNEWSSLATISSDGSGLSTLYKADGGPVLSPIWSPSGNGLAFVTGPSVDNLQVEVIQSDGSGITPVDTAKGSPLDVAWRS
jgi:dipeptidyl aminopeptidase/acylaminoacyl peptidase